MIGKLAVSGGRLVAKGGKLACDCCGTTPCGHSDCIDDGRYPGSGTVAYYSWCFSNGTQVQVTPFPASTVDHPYKPIYDLLTGVADYYGTHAYGANAFPHFREVVYGKRVQVGEEFVPYDPEFPEFGGEYVPIYEIQASTEAESSIRIILNITAGFRSPLSLWWDGITCQWGGWYVEVVLQDKYDSTDSWADLEAIDARLKSVNVHGNVGSAETFSGVWTMQDWGTKSAFATPAAPNMFTASHRQGTFEPINILSSGWITNTQIEIAVLNNTKCQSCGHCQDGTPDYNGRCRCECPTNLATSYVIYKVAGGTSTTVTWDAAHCRFTGGDFVLRWAKVFSAWELLESGTRVELFNPAPGEWADACDASPLGDYKTGGTGAATHQVQENPFP